MHPVLRLQNLDNAPLFCRDTLLDAVHADGPRALENLRFLSQRLGAKVLPKHILPVLYANLDPSPVVRMQSLDCVSPFADCLIQRVFTSMGMLTLLIQRNRVPAGSYPFIWPRLFAWIDYVDNHYDVHADIQADKRRDFGSTFVLATYELLKDDATRMLIEETPRFRTLIGRIWFSFPDVPKAPHTPWRPLGCILMDNMAFKNPGNFEEFLAGFDGGESELAAFVVKRLDPVWTDFLGPPLEIICKTRENQSFTTTLLDHGLVPALTRVIGMYAAWSTDSGPFLDEFLSAFSRGAETSHSFRWVVDGLRAGLLEALVLVGTKYSHRPDTVQYLGWFFSFFLPQALVYLPVVAVLADHFGDCVSLSEASGFQSSAVFANWVELVPLAKERLAWFKCHVHSDRSCSMQMCFNEQCGIFLSRKSMKRCLACRLCYYCSDVCQRRHWLDGNHRAECPALRLHRIASPEHWSARNRSALCTLVELEYHRHRGALYLWEIDTYQRYPDTQFCIGFDFENGKCHPQIWVATPFLSKPYPKTFSAQMHHHLTRAATIGGRMQVAVVKVTEGSINVFRIVLICHADSTVSDTLADLARTLPFGVARDDTALVRPKLQPLSDRPVPTFVYASA